MKKSLSIFIIIGLVLISCEKDDSQPNSEPTTQGEGTVGGEDTGNTHDSVDFEEVKFVFNLNTKIPKDNIEHIDSVEFIKMRGINRDSIVKQLAIKNVDIIDAFGDDIGYVETFSLSNNQLNNNINDFSIFKNTTGDGYNVAEEGYFVKIHINEEVTPTTVSGWVNEMHETNGYGITFGGNTIIKQAVILEGSRVITLYGEY